MCSYATGGNASTRTGFSSCPLGSYCPGDGYAYFCPPGTYGSSANITSFSCSGPCSPGYYCLAGSVSSQNVTCGWPGVYCPGGSSAPLSVPIGSYSTGGTNVTRSGYSICGPGTYCVNGSQVWFASLSRLSQSTMGGFCVPNSDNIL